MTAKNTRRHSSSLYQSAVFLGAGALAVSINLSAEAIGAESRIAQPESSVRMEDSLCLVLWNRLFITNPKCLGSTTLCQDLVRSLYNICAINLGPHKSEPYYLNADTPAGPIVPASLTGRMAILSKRSGKEMLRLPPAAAGMIFAVYQGSVPRG